MCLIACAWRATPTFELVIAANRDELHSRPSLPARRDPSAPWRIGGRDVVAGGSWLEFSTHGRLAAVTNVRVGMPAADRPRSRGALVSAFVAGADSATAYADRLASAASQFGRFNLLLFDGRALQLASNHPAPCSRALEPGLHVLSNGPFGAPWPKTERVREGIERWLAGAAADPAEHQPLFELLADRSQPADHALPDTGIGLAGERLLAPIFVVDPRYGTRCSTVVTLASDGRWWFEERRFDPSGRLTGCSRLSGLRD